MNNHKKEWLLHLEGCIPDDLVSDKISMYTIALEGWRRGINLKFYSELYEGKMLVNYSLSNNTKSYRFAVSKGEHVTDEARDISRNKTLTKEYLEKAGIPTPLGKSFNKDVNNAEIIKYAEEIGYPLVIKPIDGKLGKGVIPKIQSNEELANALVFVREKLEYSNVILEKYIIGDEFRVYVINNKVIGAIKKSPAKIIGDGQSSIRELIIEKNQERKTNPNLRTRLIKIDSEVRKYIKSEGYALESIPILGEKIYLRKNSNISSGGEGDGFGE